LRPAFPEPAGAAGYDKNGRTVEAMSDLGFGFVEVGSVSAYPSDGNPRPRLFRVPADRAIVVNYGLPNEGAEAVASRLAAKRIPVPLGVNIVKTNRLRPEGEEEILGDYCRSVSVLKDSGDYLVLNLSCPNTETRSDYFADPKHLVRLFERLTDLNISCPVFLKVSPLGGVPAIEGLLESVEGFSFVSGFVFNLPPGKPVPLHVPAERLEKMPGAVAGKPVEDLINTAIGELYQRMDKERYRIIGVGGVFSGEDAYKKIRLGASLVQLLTALVYEGPGVVRRIKRGLVRLLERDGVAHVSEAVGVDCR
jgi:dihydroorotate dehydrogenase